jgi:hypothetical protein
VIVKSNLFESMRHPLKFKTLLLRVIILSLYIIAKIGNEKIKSISLKSNIRVVFLSSR